MNFKEILNKYNYGDIDINDLNIKKYENDSAGYIEKLLLEIKNYDEGTYKHCIRVGILSLNIADQIGCDKKTQTEVYFGGLIHDIGKIFIPKDILNKPGKVTDEEYQVICTHPLLGAGYIYDSLHYDIVRIVRDHHEKLDGSGYPKGINRDDINFQTRIVTIADIIDGYSSNRPYHKEKTHSETMEFIASEEGLDSLMVNCLLGNENFHFKSLQREESVDA